MASKPFRFQEGVSQITKQQQSDYSADEIFQVHYFDSPSLHTLAEAHVPKRNDEKNKNQSYEDQVKHWHPSFARVRSTAFMRKFVSYARTVRTSA
jgi:hypothetical protein